MNDAVDVAQRSLLKMLEDDVARLTAQRDLYKMALERLADSNCFHSPGMIDPELRMRMVYAKEILKK